MQLAYVLHRRPLLIEFNRVQGVRPELVGSGSWHVGSPLLAVRRGTR